MSDDKPDKTLIVNPDITLKVSSDIKPSIPKGHPLNFTHFKDYSIVYSYPATGGEADIFRILKNDDEFILKLYRTGCVPKEEILSKTKKLSGEHPEHFIRLIEYGFDTETKKWYEILEYAKYQSLKEIIDNNDVKQLNLEKVLSEIFNSIEILHQHNIVHQDIKPSNILVRSIDPIDLVLTDFGMASFFTDDTLHKTDPGKGTPLYQAPEQLSGIVSPKTDYWALGIILLEIRNGKHPFKGLDLQHIKFALVTQGVEVSSELPPRDAILIKGLLTRDPKNRWGAEKVKKWINGDNDIPLFYDYNLGNQQPYPFQGYNYFTPSELVAQFIKDENNWQEAKKHLARGYLLKWFEDIKAYDHAILLDEFEKMKNVDKQLFSLIYSINNKLPFGVYGKTIDLNNLFIFAATSMKNSAPLGESTIINDLTSGNLLYYSQKYNELTHDSNPIHEVIQKLTGKNSSQIFSILEILFKPYLYLIPDDIDCNNQIDAVTILSNMAIGRTYIPIYTKEEFNALVDKYILPLGMENSIQNPTWSTRIYDIIMELQEMNLLIQRNDVTSNMDSIIKLMPATLEQGGIIRINGIGYSAYEEYIGIAKHLNWGIGKDSLFKIEKLKDFNLDDKLNGYLDALHSKKFPWEDRDVKLVDKIFSKFNAIRKYEFLFTKHSVNLFFLSITLTTLFGIILKTGLIINDLAMFGIIYDNSYDFGIWLLLILTFGIVPIILLPIIHYILMLSGWYNESERIFRATIISFFAVLILYYWITWLFGFFNGYFLNNLDLDYPLITQYMISLPSPIFKNFFDFFIPGGMIFIYLATIAGLFLFYKRKLELERSKVTLSPLMNKNYNYMTSVVNKSHSSKEIPDVF